jgi:hypothetical protein
MAIPCRSRIEHRPDWVLLDRDWCRTSAVPDGWPTPGWHTVSCPWCTRAWRSRAKYARELPLVHHRPSEAVDWVSRRITAVCEEHPLVAELTYNTEIQALAGTDWPFVSVRFLHDVALHFNRTGQLSAKQLDAVERVVQAKVSKANEAAAQQRREEAALRALGARLAPEGKGVVVGTVDRAWLAATEGTETVPKMVLRADEGYTVEVTIPAVIRRQLLHLQDLVGRRVSLHATLRRQRDDWTAAWGSRPTHLSKLLEDD